MSMCRGNWGNAKSFWFGRLKGGLRVPLYKSAGGSWEPRALIFKRTKHFRPIYFCWVHELKIQKMEIFRHCPNIAGKAEKMGKLFGAKLKIGGFIYNWRLNRVLYNQSPRDFAFASASCRVRTFICMQANVFWHLFTSSGKWMDIISYFTGTPVPARCW